MEWSSGAEGGDLREQLLHHGDGVPCVGVRAACSPRRLDSKHLISILRSARPCGGRDAEQQRTHLDGLAGLGSGGLGLLGLGFHFGG
jgi:hypothetical protein